MLREAQKFLDLDMMGQAIVDEGDRSLFQEAVQCYQIGSHRAAVILTWCATADCLRRRIYDLALEGDALAQQFRDELRAVEGQSCYEQNLIAAARKCELIDDYEERALKFARDTRSQSAHPTGLIPSAEAVRHILHLCVQSVLARRGYRGMGFVKNVVTVQFDDPHFLPNENKAEEYCRAIAARVPSRLWPQFVGIAVQERPGHNSEIWLKNAATFFRVLLAQASDFDAQHIAPAFQGFEAGDPDFFAILVGLDSRVTKFWDGQKRAQARARLIEASAARMTAEQVHSWATICAADGIDGADRALLEQKFAAISRFLANEGLFIVARRTELTDLTSKMLLDSTTAGQAAVGLTRLLSTQLFDRRSDALQVIVEAIVERFTRDQRYRVLMDSVKLWPTAMLVTLLERTELLLNQCSEDNPDDVLIVFDAATEIARREPIEMPDAFSDVINRVLRKELLSDWSEEESVVGEMFRRQLRLLLEQHESAFPYIDKATIVGEQGEDTVGNDDAREGSE